MALTLPTFASGSRVRASALTQITAALTALSPLQAWKSADETINNAGTGATLHNDIHLALPYAANTNYKLNVDMIYLESAGTSVDMKVAFTFGSNCRLDLAAQGPHVNWTSLFGSNLEAEWNAWVAETSSPTSTHTFGTVNGVSFSMVGDGTFRTGASSGTLRVQWAQGIASANTLTVKAGSSLTLQQVP